LPRRFHPAEGDLYVGIADQSQLDSILFRAVSETLLAIAADPRRLRADIGFLAVLQTWNQQM
jgi:hypothetical protein